MCIRWQQATWVVLVPITAYIPSFINVTHTELWIFDLFDISQSEQICKWQVLNMCIGWQQTTWVVPGGGTDLERGYGDVRPWRPPFYASPAVRKGPISSKRVSSQDPLLRKFGNFSLYSLNFHPNFSSQAPKFGNFQLTSPQIWKFSAHKPPFSEVNVSSQAPNFGNLGRTPLPEKKLNAPPGSTCTCAHHYPHTNFHQCSPHRELWIFDFFISQSEQICKWGIKYVHSVTTDHMGGT